MAVKKQDMDHTTIVYAEPIVMDQQSQDASVADTTATTSSSSIGPAAVAGGVVGFLVGGPVVGVLLGLGSGYVSTKQGAAGDIARATGDVAVTVREKATEINEEHHLTQKVADIMRKFCNFISKRGNDRSTPVAQEDTEIV